MGEVTPSGSKGAGIGGAIFGGVIGLIVASFLSFLAFALTGAYSGLMGSGTSGPCGTGVVWGVILLVVAAGFGWLAWFMLFRNTSRTFGASFLRGLAVIVALFLLIPWPCSYTVGALANFSACRH